MSANLKADVSRCDRNVRFVPKADIVSCQTLRLLVRATCGRCNHIEFRDNALGKKEAPTPFRGNVGAEVCARWPYGGRCLTGLAVSDA